MYRTLIILLVLCVAAMAFANDDGAVRVKPLKGPPAPSFSSPTEDPREGGETIAFALPIASLPYNDTGSTCDNIDDYDVACTYTGSTSADVVYSYVPPVDERVYLDLCLSSYDTKIYVYDAAMGVVGCNDDFWFGDPVECYTYSSFLEVMLTAGETYYIVIDGYGGMCGDYYLDITSEPYMVCEITCHDLAQPEEEPDLVPEYIDNFNGGCNSVPEVFQAPNWIDWETNCMNLSGVSGWYPAGGIDNRDTDWFEIVAMGTEVTVTILTDNEATPTRCMMTTANPSCAGYDYSFQTSVLAGCQEMTWTVPTTAGATYWIFVAPAEWISTVAEFNYCLEVCGLVYDVVPNEDASWGEVKSLYR
ncbi:MAG: hypothetical protein ACTSQ7_16605 [Alphaproteobacteria bacterium]